MHVVGRWMLTLGKRDHFPPWIGPSNGQLECPQHRGWFPQSEGSKRDCQAETTILITSPQKSHTVLSAIFQLLAASHLIQTKFKGRELGFTLWRKECQKFYECIVKPWHHLFSLLAVSRLYVPSKSSLLNQGFHWFGWFSWYISDQKNIRDFKV